MLIQKILIEVGDDGIPVFIALYQLLQEGMLKSICIKTAKILVLSCKSEDVGADVTSSWCTHAIVAVVLVCLESVVLGELIERWPIHYIITDG